MPRALALLPLLLTTSALADDPDWRAVPAGRFVPGCADERPGTQPAAPTRMPVLWVTPTRITVEQYAQCVARGECRAASPARWCDRSRPTLPATCVSYPQAERFCRTLGGRLPTAREWEFLADTGFDLALGDGVDDAHGATEWVADGEGLLAGQAETRGGVADLEPLLRCSRGSADADLETGRLGFRCVRPTPPPPVPRRPSPVERTLQPFTLAGGKLQLVVRLSDDARAHTFVGCRDALSPLGAFAGAHDVASEWGPVTRYQYEAPCREVRFVITAPDVRPGPFRALGAGPRFGAATFAACRASSGAREVEVPGNACTLRLAADLNGDDVADFLVESTDVCTETTLLVSSGDSWVVAAHGATWCPD